MSFSSFSFHNITSTLFLLMQFGIHTFRLPPPEKQSLEYAVKMAGMMNDGKNSGDDSLKMLKIENEELAKELKEAEHQIDEILKWEKENDEIINQLIVNYQELHEKVKKTL